MKDQKNNPIYRNFISGNWKSSYSEKTYDVFNPADIQEKIATVQYSISEDINEAIFSADAASESWSKTTAIQRADILFNAYNILKRRFDEIARSITLEEGKCIGDAEGEVQRALSVIQFMAGEGRRMHGYTTPSELENTLAYTYKRPLGVVSVITPWNFPLAIPAWKIAPALICGNTIVFKPAFSTPITAIKFVEVLEEAGLPPGVLNLVTGSSSTTGNALINDRRIRGVSFTGSTEIGSKVYSIASQSLAKVQCEMGGKNALIVMDDADVSKALDAIIQGAFGSTGQRCTATSRVIIHKKIYDSFVNELVLRTRKLCVGSGLNKTSDMSCLSSQQQLEQVKKYVDIGIQEKGNLLTGGKQLSDGTYDNGYFFQPTIFDNVSTNARIAQEEIFGPVLVLFKCEDARDAIRIANDCRFGLSSSIYTKNIRDSFEYINSIETGIVHVNSPTLGGEVHMPFGGIKSSGVGNREQGLEAIEFFTEVVSVYIGQ